MLLMFGFTLELNHAVWPANAMATAQRAKKRKKKKEKKHIQ
jgi:hypothetical protein